MAKVSEAEQKRLRLAVLERDGNRCIDCGTYTCHVHHIIPLGHFGKKNRHLAWQMKNMVADCPECHIPGAHTDAARKRHLLKLEEYYSYPYDDQPWLGMLGRAA